LGIARALRVAHLCMCQHVQSYQGMQHLLSFESLVELGYVSNRVTLGRRIKRGEFPAPIRLGSRNVAWLKSEIEAWEEERIAERNSEKVAA
jgi:prophage regulatory protein